MPEVDRRRFLQLTGGSAALSVLTPSIARAASIPAFRRAGSLDDVEHIVVLMQENRSFDHYFGTMRGVRGYGDPHPAILPNGKSVWRQPAGKSLKGEVLPFRPDLDNLGLQFLQDIDHGWDSQHAAFAGGNHDRWVPAKSTPATMAHLRRGDIPFHYALADAFTLCDSYHCSMLGPTDPNRYYLWSGWVGNNGKGGGPEITNVETGYSWQTYPQRLQAANVSWKIYQDLGNGLDAAHNWGFGRRCLHRQLRRQRPGLLQRLPERRARRPALRACPEGHRRGTQRRHDLLRPASDGRARPGTCRRSPGSWRPRPSASTRTGRPTSAPGTSRRCSTP